MAAITDDLDPKNDSDFQQYMRSFIGQRCFSYGKYLGSMLYFDLGEKVEVVGRRGTFYEGQYIIGIRDAYWEIRSEVSGNMVNIDSCNEEIEKSAFFTDHVLVGARVLNMEICNRNFICKFDNGTVISVDLNNRYESEDVLVQLDNGGASSLFIYSFDRLEMGVLRGN